MVSFNSNKPKYDINNSQLYCRYFLCDHIYPKEDTLIAKSELAII